MDNIQVQIDVVNASSKEMERTFNRFRALPNDETRRALDTALNTYETEKAYLRVLRERKREAGE